MKNLKFLTFALAIVATVGLVLVTQNANAVVAPEGSNKKLIVCGSGDENGTTTMGNTCTSGSNVCISHPCN